MPALSAEYNTIQLPLTNLHYVKYGQGPPLIMVPATISEIDNWIDLIKYMGQRFTAYFFELPGHGKSSPFKKRFKSEYVAETVEDFIDRLGFNTFSIMGFSFGGILTMKTLERLRHRIDRVILFAPCVTSRALTHSKQNLLFIRSMVSIMRMKTSQKMMLNILHNKATVEMILWFLSNVGKVETLGEIRRKLLELRLSTLDVLAYQMNEVLNSEFRYRPFDQKLYFGMSVHDPLLDFKTTKSTLARLFKDMETHEFDFPFHQPPKPFTFNELNEKFGDFIYRVSG